ncbi:MAG: Lrp/AsnC family transcriptional regulator [Gammaproteobacteria bacterium]|nr:Lrp/AsnC family transcriptional regulator [Gammaproteobacteria bacterium]
MTDLDHYDIKILHELQRDGSLSAEGLAARVGLSKTPCWRRVLRLRKTGVITQTVALIDGAAVGIETTVFVHVKVEKHDSELFRAIDRALRDLPEVMEAYLMMGDADYVLRVEVPNVAAFERFMTDKLHRIKGIKETKSSPALRRVKYTTQLPLATPVRPRKSPVRTRWTAPN